MRIRGTAGGIGGATLLGAPPWHAFQSRLAMTGPAAWRLALNDAAVAGPEGANVANRVSRSWLVRALKRNCQATVR